MLFLKLTKMDIVIGVCIALSTSLCVTAICSVLAQAFTHVYIR